jgi:ribosome-binding protein aMBF1 (putative translation factor)
LFIVQTVSKDVAKAIQAGRQKLGITQKDLAQVIKKIE